jgi:N-acetylglucosaminyldiphosphoundecaprenol N-acetyl-beta-D-mannosaminyltransferase
MVARIQLLGGSVDLVTSSEVLEMISASIAGHDRLVVANHNLHSLYLLSRDPAFRSFFDTADVTQIDSVPLIAWGRVLGKPVERAHRSTYLDWREAFWRLASEHRWRVFLLGSARGVADTMIERLRPRWPGVRLASHHGYFSRDPDGAENEAVVARINAFAPDVLMVGMGMPAQEIWIHQNADRVTASAMLSVGGAFDYEAGVQRPAPRWIGRLGVEWLYRFGHQPKRLFGRYFVEPWGLLGAAMRDLAISWQHRDR